MKSKANIIIGLLVLLIGTTVSAQSLKVMTYNIRLDIASDGLNDWSHRKDFWIAQMQFYDPDVFGVQEATPNQVTDLTQAFANYVKVGIGRELEGKGEASCVFFKKDRFDLLHSNTFWLSETPNQVSMGWDAACNRVCTYVLLKDKKSKQFLWVFNTHLDHMGQEARTKGIQLISKTIAELNTKNYPVIFMGDFNTTPNESRILELKKVMEDARELSQEKPFGPEGTFNGFRYDVAVKDRIDYIFLSKNSGLTVQKYAVLTDAKDLRYPSDHFPVYVELVVNKKK